ncbi:c-type cytochrome [Roseobacteraceae bacterium NS-SX3]
MYPRRQPHAAGQAAPQPETTMYPIATARIFRLQLASCVIAANVAVGLPAAAQTKGASLYEENCASCHLENGAGDAGMRTPAIAGLDRDYVLRQYRNFLNGLRGGGETRPLAQAMVDIMQELPEGAAAEISAYVASLPVAELEQETTPAGFIERGLYSGCSSCHGANGQGFPALGAPRLADQHAWYLREQLERFRDGSRGTHEADSFGRQMREIALSIAGDQEIGILVNYIAGFGE